MRFPALGEVGGRDDASARGRDAAVQLHRDVGRHVGEAGERAADRHVAADWRIRLRRCPLREVGP